ncbi:hypothetical protein ACWIGI_32285 [Nocardia sp. NPDC055321]
MAHNIYISTLLDALESRGYRGVLENPTAIGVTAPDGDRLDLPVERWFQYIDANAEGGLAAAAASYAHQATLMFATADPADANLRIRLHTDEYMDQVMQHGDRRIRLGDSLLTRQLAPGLKETVVIDLPDQIRPLNRSELKGRNANLVFGAAIRNSLAEDHVRVLEHTYGPVTVLALEADHRYVGAHAHVLTRLVDTAAARLGALVAFPAPEVVVVYPIAPVTDVAETLGLLDWIVKRYTASAEHRLLPHLFWWQPGEYERLGATGPSTGRGPDLRPLRFDADLRSKTIRTHTADTGKLIELWRNAR